MLAASGRTAGASAMNLDQLLAVWRTSPRYREQIAHWQTVEAIAGEYAPLPDGLDPRLAGALRRQGLERLYSRDEATRVLATIASRTRPRRHGNGDAQAHVLVL